MLDSYCCVPMCLSKNNGEIRFFLFEKEWEPIIRENFEIPNYRLQKHSVICMRHFKKQFLKKTQFLNNRCELTDDVVLLKGAFPTIFHNDTSSQIAHTCNEDENDEHSGTKIYNYSIALKSKANATDTSQETSHSILNSHSPDSNCETSNVSNCVKLESENLVMSENEQRKIKRENDCYHGPEIEFIKQEVIDDAVERITEDHTTGQTNHFSNDIKVEENVIDSNVNSEAEQVDVHTTKFDEATSLKSILNNCTLIVKNSYENTSTEYENVNAIRYNEVSTKEISTQCSSGFPIKHESQDTTESEKECTEEISNNCSPNSTKSNTNFQRKVVDLLKFGSDKFVDEILNKFNNSETSQSENISGTLQCENTSETVNSEIVNDETVNSETVNRNAGPSRLDCNVLNDALSRVNVHKFLALQETFEENIIDYDVEEKCRTRHTNPDFTMEETNMRKRRGSLLDVVDTKKEKTDEDTNEEICPEPLLDEAEIKKENMNEDTNEEISPEPLLNEAEIKKEKINEDTTEEISPGPLLDEAEIKREKLDEDTSVEISPRPLLDEAQIKGGMWDEDTNKEILPFDQIFVKDEIKDTNCVVTRYRDVVAKKPNNSTIGLVEINGKYLDEEGLYVRINKCNLCDLFFFQTLKEHTIERHQTGIFFTCPYCDWSTGRAHSTASEATRHKELFQIDCEYCGETLPNWTALTDHISNIHDDKANTTCVICGYEAHSYSVLIQHIIIQHDCDTLTHDCQHCNYSTMNSSLFSYHVKAKHTDSSEAPPHTSSKNTKKSIEPTKISKKLLKAMEKKGTKQSNVTNLHPKITKKCSICNFKTVYNGNLRRHMRRAHPDND